MENQAGEEDVRDTDNPNYAHANQNLEDDDIAYPEQIPMEKMQYAQEGQNTENAQYAEEKLPPIYAKEIESVKETTEHQIKYFEPIQISSDQDVGKFLQSGQLMQQIAPKIAALKKETQNQSISNDPLVHTEVRYDEIKQNAAIYNNPNNEDNQSKSLHNSQNDKLNATSSYSNNKFALGQQANYDMSKTQQFNKNNNGNLEGPGGIKYSAVLPPKYANKVITIDEYGNKQEEESQLELESQIQGELDEDPEDNDETVSQKEQQKQRNQMLERRKLEQEQLTKQNIQKQKLQKQQIEQQNLLLKQQQMQQQQLQQQQLQQQQLQQQQLKQQQLQQQQLQQQQQLIQQQFQQQQLQQQQLQQQIQQEQLKLQKLQQIQQQLKTQKFPQQQLKQQQLQLQTIQNQILQQQFTITQLQQLHQNQIVQQRLLQQKQLEQQLQQQRLQQKQNQGITPQVRPSQPGQNVSPYTRAYSGNNLGNLSTNNTQRNIQSNNQQMQIHYQSKSPFRNITINSLNQPQKDPLVQKAFKISGKLRPRKRNTQNNDTLNLAVLKIQNKWRNHFIKMRFENIKPQLKKDSENFLMSQYNLCDKGGQVLSDEDFSLEGWKKFYPINDPFFNFKKGFVIPYGIKIKHPNDPEKVQVYEGDINMDNERHGFGRLTTTKSVFLGEWRNDEFTGWGRETRRSGKVLEGKYIKGVVEGKGILKNSKGNTYIGDFSNSKRHGKGILETHTIHYEGEFKNDKLSGKGKIIFKKEGHVYEGEFENNEINGFGTFKWKNGDSYTGQMMNGKMHGRGKYIYNNGQVFEGNYVNGIKQRKANNNNPNLNSTISKNRDPKGLNISGITVDNNMKFGKK